MTEPQETRIGFIGLGNMGSRMAANMMKAGYQLTVHDLRRAAATPLLEEGATWADTPREVSAQSEIVFTSLPGPREVEAVALGDDGILSGIRRDAVYIDLSTNSPSLVRQVQATMAEQGVHMLDAPVSGGVIGAHTGRLVVMVGGDEAIFQRCRPLLEAIGDKVTYTGAIGCGSICKLMHNTIVYGIQTIAAECYTLGVKAGVEPGPLTEAIANGSAGRGTLFHYTFPETFLQGKFDPPQFALQLAHKDVGLGVGLGREFSVPMAMANLVYQELTTAMNRGWQGSDSRVAMKLQEERAGVQVRVKGGSTT